MPKPYKTLGSSGNTDKSRVRYGVAVRHRIGCYKGEGLAKAFYVETI